jgi:hypothetical protein
MEDTKKSIQYIIQQRIKHIDNSFNIFTEISDIYWRENFHSKILKVILDPNTKILSNGENTYLKLFANIFIKSLHNVEFSDNIKVTTEEPTEDGRIDIYIHDITNNQAILIENKLNNASDMPNQLPRYYEYTQRKKINLISIIYIPLFLKEPPFESYSKKYQSIIEILKKLTKVVSCRDLTIWLDKCVNETDHNNEIARVFISQYSNLLKSIGEDNMIVQKEIEIIKHVFETQENLQLFKELGKLWENRTTIVYNAMIEELGNIGFVIKQNYITCELSNNASLIFKQLFNVFNMGIAFRKDIPEKDKKIIMNIIQTKVNKSYISKEYKEWDIDKETLCYFLEFNLDHFDETYTYMVELLKSIFIDYSIALKENNIISEALK